MLPVWSRTEPLSWASAALTCAYAALQERKRTRANMTNAKPRFIFPPAGEEWAYERSFDLVAEETRNRTIRALIPERAIVLQRKQMSRIKFLYQSNLPG